MGATIAYDLPVRDFIDELDETGHVTHTQHRKSIVTLHHNGGRLSHEGVLSVWQVRPASAHFNVDRPGTLAQFVRIAEYAWATGTTEGNQRSISIEMCNETVGPEWKVAETTWRAAARLAGWIFARVIGARPTRDTLVVHKYWSATTCAGPWIDAVYDHILWFAQQGYDAFASGRTPEEGDGVSVEDAKTALRELVRDTNFMGEWRGQTISHQELVIPGETDPDTGGPATTSVQAEAQNNRNNFRRVYEALDGIKEGGIPVTMTEADHVAIASKVRLGLLEDLEPLFALARRLES